jgi:hypothetical protein
MPSQEGALRHGGWPGATVVVVAVGCRVEAQRSIHHADAPRNCLYHPPRGLSPKVSFVASGALDEHIQLTADAVGGMPRIRGCRSGSSFERAQ